jgi:hypothetical protein
VTLTDWRRDVVGLSLAEAARRAGISQAQATQIEQRPDRAALGAVVHYVRALDGDARLVLSHGGDARDLAL